MSKETTEQREQRYLKVIADLLGFCEVAEHVNYWDDIPPEEKTETFRDGEFYYCGNGEPVGINLSELGIHWDKRTY